MGTAHHVAEFTNACRMTLTRVGMQTHELAANDPECSNSTVAGRFVWFAEHKLGRSEHTAPSNAAAVRRREYA
jgi:hypothetical protein